MVHDANIVISHAIYLRSSQEKYFLLIFSFLFLSYAERIRSAYITLHLQLYKDKKVMFRSPPKSRHSVTLHYGRHLQQKIVICIKIEYIYYKTNTSFFLRKRKR